ncbi:Transcription factor ACEII [Madurella mycetomatis]|uniref:Transcription factor ACEII n=1 Tax=Madurella mycetomatis TaxID=100816 RepID=A0A175W434_9PEZI|nr:Transcription factor ACEII [Madurella mycetomatis]
MQSGLISPNTAWDFFSGFMSPPPGNPESGIGVACGATPLLTNAAGPSSNALPATAAAPDPAPYIRQLADLNVKLYEHCKMLSPICPNPPAVPPSLSNARLFPIDSTFLLTQSLIEITTHLYPAASPFPGGSSGSSGSSGRGNSTGSCSVPDGPHTDQATALLLLSCANRVFDIFSLLFGHMRSCIAHNATPIRVDGKTLALPQLRIGKFAPPTEVAVAGYMFIVILMAGGLFERLREALGLWGGWGRRHRGRGGRPEPRRRRLGNAPVRLARLCRAGQGRDREESARGGKRDCEHQDAVFRYA